MASCPHNDTSFNLFPPLCSASVSLWLRHFGLKGAKEKSRLPKQWTIAVAPGHSGTELLPSFHSNHQENVSLLSPFLFERMSLALCERNQAPKKNRFFFFYKGWKVNITFYWATDSRGRPSASSPLFCWSMQWTFHARVYTQLRLNVDWSTQRDQIFETSSIDYFPD